MAAQEVHPTVAPDALIERVQRLTEELEAIGDPRARAAAEELIAAVLELHGEGLARIVGILEEAGEPAAALRDAFVGDGVVASLLLIHGLYPVPLEERVREGLDSVRPYMESHGGDVELVSLDDGVAHLRLEGSCETCAASSLTLELAVKQALEEAAPDLVGIEVEGTGSPPATGLELPMADASLAALDATVSARTAGPEWVVVDGLGGLAEGALTALRVRDSALVVANVSGTLLAYLDACAGCGAPLGGAALDGGVLRCSGCGRGFDLPRAGRCPDEDLQLRPVPLLRGADAEVKVALGP